MNAAEALHAARAAGINVGIDGDDLVLEAAAPPPPSVIDALSHYKVDIIALLRPMSERRSAVDWQAFFDERAGVAEFDGGLPSAKTEAMAFASCVIEWLNEHPAPSVPGRCVSCGISESPSAVVLPFGTEAGTHAWLHAECWPDWHRARRAEAAAALAAMGILGLDQAGANHG
jgi:hypothetical protein